MKEKGKKGYYQQCKRNAEWQWLKADLADCEQWNHQGNMEL